MLYTPKSLNSILRSWYEISPDYLLKRDHVPVKFKKTDENVRSRKEIKTQEGKKTKEEFIVHKYFTYHWTKVQDSSPRNKFHPPENSNPSNYYNTFESMDFW